MTKASSRASTNRRAATDGEAAERRVASAGRSVSAVIGIGSCGRRSDGALLQLAPLALGQSAPDAEALVVREGVLEALGADLAADAYLLRLAGRPALLGEERLGIGLRAERPLLPGQGARLVVLARHQGHQLVHIALLDPCPALDLAQLDPHVPDASGASPFTVPWFPRLPEPRTTMRELHACHMRFVKPRRARSSLLPTRPGVSCTPFGARPHPHPMPRSGGRGPSARRS
ncbi:hypothetical protein BN12_2670003 [Nostocoides japonicum T1-X7]|uniref:Uncharacterized protein n=1 Tax=Nostocoides japonicum T1-X7 TaxID=1194083 RepID=A0A077M209_9MICO|nr:hypothetical protein BN12_2670003 [Tetrasphaera japonica T1-X7]